MHHVWWHIQQLGGPVVSLPVATVVDWQCISSHAHIHSSMVVATKFIDNLASVTGGWPCHWCGRVYATDLASVSIAGIWAMRQMFQHMGRVVVDKDLKKSAGILFTAGATF